jgi:hypothetical protein
MNEPTRGQPIAGRDSFAPLSTDGAVGNICCLQVEVRAPTPQQSNGPLVLSAGLESFAPGSNGAQVTVPPDVPAGGDLLLTINVYGDGSDYASYRAAAPTLQLIVP